MFLLFGKLPLGIASPSVSPCWQTIAYALGWRTVPSKSMVTCLVKSETISESLLQFCSPDQTKLTTFFQDYIGYKIAWDRANSAYQAESDFVKRQNIFQQMQDIDRDWEVFGYKPDIANRLAEMHFDRIGRCSAQE